MPLFSKEYFADIIELDQLKERQRRLEQNLREKQDEERCRSRLRTEIEKRRANIQLNEYLLKNGRFGS